MNAKDSFDWPWLFYLGTEVLSYGKREFWFAPPVQLFALSNEHLKYNYRPTDSADGTPGPDEPVYMDQLFGR